MDKPVTVLRMTAPLVISFWMRAAFTLVDTIYAATLGDHAIAAIGLTVPFEYLMIAVWVGLSTGLTSCLSRAMGARQGRKMAQYVAAAKRLVAVAAPAYGLLGAVIWVVAGHLPIDPRTAEAFRIYGTVLVAGSGATAFWSVIPDSIVKAHHDTRSTMWAGIASNVVNLVLNTVFVFVFHWGVFGIALSTVVGRLAGLAYATARARAHEARRIAAGTHDVAGLDPHPYRSVLALAVPSALAFTLMALEAQIANQLLALLPDSTEAIAAYSIYARAAMFVLQPVIAGAVALLPYAAGRIGARDLAGVRAAIRQLGLASAGYVLAFAGPVSWWLARPVAAALTDSPAAEDYTAFSLRLVPLAVAISVPFLLARPVFEALGQGRPGLIMAGLRHIVLAAPAAWFGLHAAGYEGMVVGLLAASAVVSAAFVAWLAAALGRCEAQWRAAGAPG